MKWTNEAMELHMKRTLENETPDVWNHILLRVEAQEGAKDYMEEMNEHSKKKLFGFRKWIMGIAAAVVLFAGYLGHGYYTPQSVISFDVNPSIELTINQSERVLSATPLSEDAKIILQDMDLKNTDLDVAVNAIIGSMVKEGYISEIKNSILISVDSKDSTQGMRLQERLMSEVNELLERYAVHGAVLVQSMATDSRLTGLAEEYRISVGKTQLIDFLVSHDETLSYDGLAELSINDLNLLVASKKVVMADVSSSGQASANQYISTEEARSIALKHASVSEIDVWEMSIELDYEYRTMVYEVEFSALGKEYEYEIDALTGKIVRSKETIDEDYFKRMHRAPVDNVSIPVPTNSTISPAPISANSSIGASEHRVKEEISNNGQNNRIGLESAKAIAFGHAGVTASQIRDLDCDLDNENGVMVYEIGFQYNRMEYEYDIDAITGEILWWDSEYDD